MYFCRETRYCARNIEATRAGDREGREKIEARPSRISNERARPHAMLAMNEIKNLGECNAKLYDARVCISVYFAETKCNYEYVTLRVTGRLIIS